MSALQCADLQDIASGLQRRKAISQPDCVFYCYSQEYCF